MKKADLLILDKSRGNCSSILGNAFEVPEGADARTFLAGAPEFAIDECEVYGVTFEWWWRT